MQSLKGCREPGRRRCRRRGRITSGSTPALAHHHARRTNLTMVRADKRARGAGEKGGYGVGRYGASRAARATAVGQTLKRAIGEEADPGEEAVGPLGRRPGWHRAGAGHGGGEERRGLAWDGAAGCGVRRQRGGWPAAGGARERGGGRLGGAIARGPGLDEMGPNRKVCEPTVY